MQKWFSRTKAKLAVAVIATTLIVVPTTALASNTFGDVPDSNIFHDDIQWMFDNGVTFGCGSGNYCPSDNVTREQMAAFMKRLSTSKVVKAKTAITAESAGTADVATTAGHATTADSAATAGHATTAADADTLDGLNSTSFLGAGEIVKGYHPAAIIRNGPSGTPEYYVDGTIVENAMQFPIDGPGIIDGVAYGPAEIEICYQANGTGYLPSVSLYSIHGSVATSEATDSTVLASTVDACHLWSLSSVKYKDAWSLFSQPLGVGGVTIQSVVVTWQPTSTRTTATP